VEVSREASKPTAILTCRFSFFVHPDIAGVFLLDIAQSTTRGVAKRIVRLLTRRGLLSGLARPGRWPPE
jgi:hypothetical protein